MVAQGGQDSSVKLSVHFIHFYPLKRPNFFSVWHGPPSRWLPFEHSSTKVGSLDIDPVYSTLYPSITSTCSTSNFHFNTFQYSIEGAVMLDAITYGQDCTLVANEEKQDGQSTRERYNESFGISLKVLCCRHI